ncbi:Gnt-I system low-affinity gluconate transporter [Leeuwenhoekiella aestuarii]|uniref:Gnt-I system low-affinity gluconate transporter n=1 Tax=Leeuwenhoekiella aestuarii TaxID=2249426 RepID=A0A4Q0NVQ1_9FLAO|nr:gluconate:H+ symporter [Leeuwenhoekiella aestuarii]RXG15432.1 Gnt-I system low-affinity gluconate transporter [Leeuwenhoekiella aestuarii]RXG17461.1 Gnt-I system low-affinity gluconate transporter [Leeuwenhoekiella aestuarii]
MDYQLLFAVITGIALLLFLILKLKLQAFLALLIVCIVVGALSGLNPDSILDSITTGMGGTLGFVATVVGLGSLFGAVLEHSGGAQQLAQYLLSKFGIKKAPWSIMLAGFFIAIPVFFDVAFIILIPLIYALQRNTKKSLLLYALPLLAGLAVTHAFIPPTPGPIAVADILGANLGWVIVFGFVTGIPTAAISGPFFAKFISKRIHIDAPYESFEEEKSKTELPSAGTILSIIFLPIFLIVLNTVFTSPLVEDWSIPQPISFLIALLGHPFTALILANIIAWYVLGIRRNVAKEELLKISTKALYPAGVIILLTGAGGAFKQILIDTGIGEGIAASLSSEYFPPVVFGFLVAAIVRVMQGSSTVAMITAAGITSPLLAAADYGEMQLAILVIAIAAGASIFSHVNDSGFWLVKQYLGLTEKQTFKTWSVLTTLIAATGLVVSTTLWYLV